MMLHVPVPRLLPLTIAALGVVLAVKSVDLVRDAASFPQDPDGVTVVASARAAVPDKPPVAAAPAPARPAPTTLPKEADATPPVSDEERAVLLELRQRRQELDGRELALTTRESVLAAAEQKLSARVDELTALQKKLEALEDGRRQREESGWQGLVKLYESMKPRDAATIFNDLQMPVLLNLLDRMKEAKAAPIVAAMNPDKARDATARLADLRTHRENLAAAPRGG